MFGLLLISAGRRLESRQPLLESILQQSMVDNHTTRLVTSSGISRLPRAVQQIHRRKLDTLTEPNINFTPLPPPPPHPHLSIENDKLCLIRANQD